MSTLDGSVEIFPSATTLQALGDRVDKTLRLAHAGGVVTAAAARVGNRDTLLGARRELALTPAEGASRSDGSKDDKGERGTHGEVKECEEMRVEGGGRSDRYTGEKKHGYVDKRVLKGIARGSFFKAA